METNTIRSTYVEMTPELAQKYLDTMQENRKMNLGWAGRLAEVINNGEWILDGNSIKMDDAGHLIDGQHRLRAVIMSGKTVTMEVKSGFSHDTIYTIDAYTKPRSMADVASLYGIADASMVSGIIHAYSREKQNQFDTGRPTKISPNTMLRLYEKAPATWNEIKKRSYNIACSRSKVTMPLISVRQVGGMAAYLILDKNYSEEKVFSFFERALSTTACTNVSIEKLRCALIKNKMATKHYPWSIVHQMVVKTWNAYVTGRTVRNLRVLKDEARVEFI